MWDVGVVGESWVRLVARGVDVILVESHIRAFQGFL
jgi:hypothetical protein